MVATCAQNGRQLAAIFDRITELNEPTLCARERALSTQSSFFSQETTHVLVAKRYRVVFDDEWLFTKALLGHFATAVSNDQVRATLLFR